jgi:lycopene cyclase domain-containing protein
MSYASFLLVFILPIIGVLAYLQSKNGTSLMPRWRLGIVLMAALALLYTTPWDNYLIYRGVWSYSPDRVWESWRLGYVPLEEYLFFVLQPVMTGLFYPATSKPCSTMVSAATALADATGGGRLDRSLVNGDRRLGCPKKWPMDLFRTHFGLGWTGVGFAMGLWRGLFMEGTSNLFLHIGNGDGLFVGGGPDRH